MAQNNNFSHEEKAMQDLERELAEVKKSLMALDSLQDKKGNAEVAEKTTTKGSSFASSSPKPSLTANAKPSQPVLKRKEEVKRMKVAHRQEADATLKGLVKSVHDYLDFISESRRKAFDEFWTNVVEEHRKERLSERNAFKKRSLEDRKERIELLLNFRKEIIEYLEESRKSRLESFDDFFQEIHEEKLIREEFLMNFKKDGLHGKKERLEWLQDMKLETTEKNKSFVEQLRKEAQDEKEARLELMVSIRKELGH